MKYDPGLLTNLEAKVDLKPHYYIALSPSFAKAKWTGWVISSIVINPSNKESRERTERERAHTHTHRGQRENREREHRERERTERENRERD